jgi:hypothetical protein
MFFDYAVIPEFNCWRKNCHGAAGVGALARTHRVPAAQTRAAFIGT